MLFVAMVTASLSFGLDSADLERAALTPTSSVCKTALRIRTSADAKLSTMKPVKTRPDHSTLCMNISLKALDIKNPHNSEQ